MKNNLFDLHARFNGNVPRNVQGESRGDFWTLQDNVSRKETRRKTDTDPHGMNDSRTMDTAFLQDDPDSSSRHEMSLLRSGFEVLGWQIHSFRRHAMLAGEI